MISTFGLVRLTDQIAGWVVNDRDSDGSLDFSTSGGLHGEYVVLLATEKHPERLAELKAIQDEWSQGVKTTPYD